VNRRGRPVCCLLSFAPLSSDGAAIRGAIVMMEPVEAEREAV
jgi:hypothetical protein